MIEILLRYWDIFLLGGLAGLLFILAIIFLSARRAYVLVRGFNNTYSVKKVSLKYDDRAGMYYFTLDGEKFHVSNSIGSFKGKPFFGIDLISRGELTIGSQKLDEHEIRYVAWLKSNLLMQSEYDRLQKRFKQQLIYTVLGMGAVAAIGFIVIYLQYQQLWEWFSRLIPQVIW